jgi:hypothetical protein
MSENIISWQFSAIEVVGLWVICFFACLFAIGAMRWWDRVLKRRMMEDFLSHIQQKIQTEEEFQDIIEQMRRDFGGGPTGNN